jgi:hypothetical protein
MSKIPLIDLQAGLQESCLHHAKLMKYFLNEAKTSQLKYTRDLNQCVDAILKDIDLMRRLKDESGPELKHRKSRKTFLPQQINVDSQISSSEVEFQPQFSSTENFQPQTHSTVNENIYRHQNEHKELEAIHEFLQETTKHQDDIEEFIKYFDEHLRPSLK